jgi:dTDP-glucose 4,6-dehydratase
MTRVLLTGGSGFAGSHVLRALLAGTDWDVTCVASWRHRGEPSRILSALDGRTRDRVTVLTHDLSAAMPPGVLGGLGQADVVMNIASDSHVERSIAGPAAFAANNIMLMLTMLEYARAAPPRLFLQMGTDEVYGPMAGGVPNREWDTLIPSNPYSSSKASQDCLAVAWWRTYGLPLIMTRTMNLYGPAQDSEKFVPMVLRKVLAGETVTIHASPDGVPGSRCWIDVREFAAAWLFLAMSHEPARYPAASRPDLFHIVGTPRDNLSVALEIAEIAGRPLKYELVSFHASRPGHDLAYGLNGSKLAAAGWKPRRTMTESLAGTVEWYLRHPEWELLQSAHAAPGPSRLGPAIPARALVDPG